MKKVVNAIILDATNEKILVIKRKGGIHSRKWAFPGGVVELGETCEDALRREIREEVGIKMGRIIKKVGKFEFLREDNKRTIGESFLVSVKNKKIKINKSEIEEFRWATIEELGAFDCTPGIEEEAMIALYSDAWERVESTK